MLKEVGNWWPASHRASSFWNASLCKSDSAARVAHMADAIASPPIAAAMHTTFRPTISEMASFGRTRP